MNDKGQNLIDLLHILITQGGGKTFRDKVYVVGGYVRDKLLGLDCTDIDVCVELEGGAAVFSEFIHHALGSNIVSKPHNIGKAYPIWKIKFYTNPTWDNKVYDVEGLVVDIADTQKEKFPDITSRQRTTQYGDLFDDIFRRDFTINAMMINVTTLLEEDYTGMGKYDLEGHLLRSCNFTSPQQSFTEDPLRILRLIRFAVKLGFNTEPETLKGAVAELHRLDIVSDDRIRQEIVKICECGKLAQAVDLMDKMGALALIFPEVKALQGCLQDPKWHAEGDAYIHTLLVTKNARCGVIPQLAALCHDLGKARTVSVNETGTHHYGHENVSAELTTVLMKRLNFDLETTRHVVGAVGWHMVPRTGQDWSVKTTRRFIRDTGDLLNNVLDLAEADCAGALLQDNTTRENYVPALKQKIIKCYDVPIKRQSILSGEEIMRVLILKPGKDVGKALKMAIDIEDEEIEKGRSPSKMGVMNLLAQAWAKETNKDVRTG